MLEALRGTAFTLFGAPTSWAEVIGFGSGALVVWLAVVQHAPADRGPLRRVHRVVRAGLRNGTADYRSPAPAIA